MNKDRSAAGMKLQKIMNKFYWSFIFISLEFCLDFTKFQ